MEQLIPIAAQFGIVGLTLLAAGWFIVYRDRINTRIVDVVASRHEGERKEWREIIDRQHQECIQARQEATEAVIANTSALSKISTIIEERRP